jgi:hypothetical protein
MDEPDIIKNFFLPPENFSQNDSTFSKLHLLRRDILTCYGINPNNGEKINYSVLFPGTITLFAGIDLLAKLYYVNDFKLSSSKRFLNFLENTKLIRKEDANILYQLRNALVHSFGLESIDRTYQFILTENDIFIKSSNNKYEISYLKLNSFFEECIFFIHKKIMTDKIFRINFTHKIKEIGFLQILH